MKISKKALRLISGTENRPLRLRIALGLGFSERWIERLIEENKPNGKLTTAAAIQLIKEGTGLKDVEILDATEKVV